MPSIILIENQLKVSRESLKRIRDQITVLKKRERTTVKKVTEKYLAAKADTDYFTSEADSRVFSCFLVGLQKSTRAIFKKLRTVLDDLLLKHEKKVRVLLIAKNLMTKKSSLSEKTNVILDNEIRYTKSKIKELKLTEGLNKTDDLDIFTRRLKLYLRSKDLIQKYRTARNKRKKEKLSSIKKETAKDKSLEKEWERRQFVMDKKNIPCKDCNKLKSDMTFDHLRDKKFTISGSWRSKSMGAIKKEVEKCEVVCRLCHDTREYLRGQMYQSKTPPKHIIRNFRNHFQKKQAIEKERTKIPQKSLKANVIPKGIKKPTKKEIKKIQRMLKKKKNLDVDDLNIIAFKLRMK